MHLGSVAGREEAAGQLRESAWAWGTAVPAEAGAISVRGGAEAAPFPVTDRPAAGEPASQPRVWMEASEQGARAWLKVDDRVLGPLRVELATAGERVEATIHVDRPEVGRLVQACEAEIRSLLTQQQFREISVQVRCGGGEPAGSESHHTPRQTSASLPSLHEHLPPAPRRPAISVWGGLIEVWA